MKWFEGSTNMKIIFWNTKGLRDVSKRIALKRFLKKHNTKLILIQETKRDKFDSDLFHQILMELKRNWMGICGIIWQV